MARKIGSRYTAHQVIGRGSAGTVWLGEGPEGPVAIKLLREDLASDQVLVGRFVQERTALTSLDHPRVVGVHDLVVDGDDLALVMELVHGADLRSRLDREGPLTPQAAVSIAADVAEGLAVAHAAGIVHRDVKPENILLDQASSPGPGGAPRAKLSDFGIARLVDAPRRTRATRIIGTPDYLAPEVIEGLEPRAAVDIYALATVLYELLAGFTPFGGGHTGAVLRRHVTEAVTPLPGLPEELWKVVSQCLAKAPASRLRAAELAARLREQLPSLAGVARLDVAHPALPPAVLDLPPDPDPDEEAEEAEARAPRRRRGPAVPLVPGARPDSNRDTHTSLRRPSADELASFAAASRTARAAGDRPRPGGSTAHGRTGGRRGGPGAAVHRRRRVVASVLALLVVAAVALGAYKAFAGSDLHGRRGGEGIGRAALTPGTSTDASDASSSASAPAGAAAPAVAALPVWAVWTTAPAPPVPLADGIRAARVGGTAYVFGTDADGYVRYLTRGAGPDGGFGHWGTVSGIQVSGEPAPVAMPDGSLRLFATGVDGLVYQNTLHGGGWTGWGQLDGRTHVDSPPAAALTGTRIYLVARTGSGLSSTSATNGSNGPWSPWATVRAAGSITGAPALTADGSGGLDAFVVPADGGPVLRVPAPGGVWQTPAAVTGVITTTRPDAVLAADGRQYVFGAPGTEAATGPGGTDWTVGTLRGTPGAPGAYADGTGVGLFVSTPGGSLLYTHTV